MQLTNDIPSKEGYYFLKDMAMNLIKIEKVFKDKSGKLRDRFGYVTNKYHKQCLFARIDSKYYE